VDPLIVAFGHKARNGKDEAIKAIVASCADARVEVYSFGAALKQEVLEAFFTAPHPYWAYVTAERIGAHKRGPIGGIAAYFDRVQVRNCGCWLWTGKQNEKGYGITYTPACENYRAHRFMWEVVLGNPPEPLLRHSCDVRNCVNPLHLLPGAPADNSADMVARGRSQCGEDHSQSTISDVVVQQVRELHAGGMRQSEICRQLSLASGSVSRIVNNLTRVSGEATPLAIPPTVFSRDWLTDTHKGKFRRLLQHFGTEFRRAQDPDYWVRKTLARISEERPDFALINDLRFPNEMKAIQAAGGYVVRVTRVGFVSDVPEHVSETALNHLTPLDWDYCIEAPDGQLEVLKDEALNAFEFIRAVHRAGLA
jgi:hypothetical protein